jgi:hypothetical protein
LAALALVGPGLARAAETSPKPDTTGGAEQAVSEEAMLAELAELEKLARPPVWSVGGSLRAGGGYRDNVLLSSFSPVRAGFLTVGGDFTLNRLPVDGTEVSLLASGDYIAFVEEPAAEPEALVLTQAEIKRALGRDWTAGLRAQYVFLNQFYDVSATEAELTTVLARGHLVSAAPSLSRSLGGDWSFTAACEGARQIFESPLDPYWEATPTGTLTRSLGQRGEIALTYRYDRRWYDERPALDAEGHALPFRLQFDSHEAELRPRVYWDAARHWSTRLRLGALVNRDNGGGYFDYTRYSAGVQLRYRAAGWTCLAELRALRYEYETRRVAGPASPLRRKDDWSLRLRAERQLSRRWTLFAQWDRETSADRLPDSDYQANTVQVGLEWEP